MSKRPEPSSDPNAESHDDSGSFVFAPAEPEKRVFTGGLDAESILSLADDARRRAAGSDPYNRTATDAADHSGKDKNNKRSLDDMRELSHAIKSAPTWTPPDRKKPTALADRIVILSAELERALAELRELCAAASDPADRQITEMKAQLRQAANYLEEVLDCLIPTEASS